MSELKIKLELNKGRKGVPIDRLAQVANEARKFFEMFAKDIELGDGEWIAEEFTNGSLGFDNTFVGDANPRGLVVAQKALRHISDPKRTPDDLAYGIRRETLFQYGKMADPLPPDDVLFVGIYDDGKPEPELRELSKERFLEIEKQIVERTTHYGGLQGTITALFKGSNTIWVHDLSTRAKVVCEFAAHEYEKIWKLLETKDAVVNVEGWIKRKPGELDHLKIEIIDPAAEYREGDLEKFFGIDPDFTGDMSTEEYLNDLRSETTEEYPKRLVNE
jgi:hypothetical protein